MRGLRPSARLYHCAFKSGAHRYSYYDGQDARDPDRAGYFNAILLLDAALKHVSSVLTWFPTSAMERALLSCTATTSTGETIALFTSHLESLDNQYQAKERCKQMEVVMSRLAAAAPPASVAGNSHEIVVHIASPAQDASLAVFGGDTNLTDFDEGRYAAGGRLIPADSGIVDAWLAAGADKHSRWTWDMSRNPYYFEDAPYDDEAPLTAAPAASASTSASAASAAPEGFSTPTKDSRPRSDKRRRFDHFYVKYGQRQADGGEPPLTFSVFGRELMPARSHCPSDHYGIMIELPSKVA